MRGPMRHLWMLSALSMAAACQGMSAPQQSAGATGQGGSAQSTGAAGSTGGSAGDGGPSDGSGLPTCGSDLDCLAYSDTATCQQGYCCAGKLVNGVCSCGGGPACDDLHTCCDFCGTVSPAVCSKTCPISCPPPPK